MDHRIEIRRARLTPVVVSHDSWPWPEVLVATDINSRGLYLTAERRLLPGDECVRLSFKLGTGELWEMDGRVARFQFRRRQVDPGYSGMGVELWGLSPVERLRVRELLRGVPPPLPPSVVAARTPKGTGRRRRSRFGGRRGSDPLGASWWGRGRLTLSGRPPMVGTSRRSI